jgi:hypothetical protein
MSPRKTRSPDRPGRTIAEFCAAYDIGRSTWYDWASKGLTPQVLQPAGPKGRAFITPEAEAAWKAQHTGLTPQPE